VYVGDQALSSTLDHSLMEQAVYGHDFKTLDYTATFTCNIAKVAQDDYWAGSEMFNCAEGRRCNVQNNTLVTGKPPTAAQPQQEMGGWATDFEVA
jgi:hypothetical protein